MTLLRMNNLRMQYPGAERPALDDIDLTIERGQRIAVLGLSGAGKSTLIRCINRLVEPIAGEIVWFGESDGADSALAGADHSDATGIAVRSLKGVALRTYRRRIGMIFQEFHLVDRLSVLANVLMGRFGYVTPWRAALGRYAPRDVEAAYAALERVGLQRYERRRARELSGGQRQRVAIARALVQQPLLLLGDEPVSNLDPMTARDVMQLLAEINQRDGLTMNINLHSVELAMEFAQRVIGMHDGRIVFDDTPDRLDDAALKAIYASAPAGVGAG